jgi:hypothetical protein
MKQTFTTNDLIKLLYCECTHDEAADIAYGLESEERLNTEFAELQIAHRELSKLTVKAPSHCIRNILDYSSRTALETQI